MQLNKRIKLIFSLVILFFGHLKCCTNTKKLFGNLKTRTYDNKFAKKTLCELHFMITYTLANTKNLV